MKCDPDSYPEYYITKGLIEKTNYFMDETQMIDLEYNIPMQYFETKHEGMFNTTSSFNQ